MPRKTIVPIYEYQAINPDKGCSRCRKVFEIIQGIEERPLGRCPACGTEVKKLISRCLGVIMETPEAIKQNERKIRDYEQAGMWSHAAEMADTCAEKTKDTGLKVRAIEDYRKAGHDVDGLTGE